MKAKRFFWAAGFAAALLALFFVTRYALPGLYTPEWAARHVFWLVAAVVFIPALYGKVRFSSAALAGYVAGLAAGELLGGWEADVGPQYLHHGWWILLLVFAASCLIGIAAEKRAKKKS